MSPSSSDLEALRKTWQVAGQDHVFTFYDQLSPKEQQSLYDQLVSINPSRVNSIHSAALQAEKDAANSTSDDISPPPSDCVGTIIGHPEQANEWNEIGLKSIKEGKVGVLLMAGGQGTRLGSSAPKGCYDIGLPSHKSLFQLQAERIKRLEIVAQASQSIPWYIMTSGPTRKPTEDFFKQNAYFGLKEDQIIFFEQGEEGFSRARFFPLVLTDTLLYDPRCPTLFDRRREDLPRHSFFRRRRSRWKWWTLRGPPNPPLAFVGPYRPFRPLLAQHLVPPRLLRRQLSRQSRRPRIPRILHLSRIRLRSQSR